MTKRKTNPSIWNRISSFPEKHSVLFVVIVVVFLAVSFYGYNKYLDWQNVRDMEQLLTSFEQLEKDVEAETGEEFYIETACDSIGGEKFSTSYDCGMFLLSESSIDPSEYITADRVFDENNCRVLVNGNDKYKNALQCLKPGRPSNISAIEKLVFDYDTTPGREF